MLAFERIETAGPIQQSVIWLHGLGADGNDFVPIVDRLSLTNTRYIFPHAPQRPVTLNHGYVMPAWFDIYGLAGNDKQDVEGMRSMSAQIDLLIQNEIDAGIASERILLAGFSQGGAMASYCALQYPQRLAGLMMLSSYLPQKHTLLQQVSEANRHLPIFITHGLWDDIIPIASFREMLSIFSQSGFTPQAHEYEMAHSLCDEEIGDIDCFMRGIFYVADGVK